MSVEEIQQVDEVREVLAVPALESAGPVTTESITEAMLLATDSPLPAARIAQIIGGGATPGAIKECIARLNEKYEQTGASFRIEEIAKGFQILTLPEYNVWLKKLLRVRTETKLSQAGLETLAVVAYRQPVMRAAIEEIRGVAGGEVLQRLREMNLVKIVGRAEELGRPLLYGTTKRFLEIFGLASLDQLPSVEELTPPDKQKKTPISIAAIEMPLVSAVETIDHDPFARLAAEARSNSSDATADDIQPDVEPISDHALHDEGDA